MYKIILYLLTLVLCMWMMALQLDEERAMYTLFWIKHGVNRATHAAAQQLDESLLARGEISIEPNAAYQAAMQYLQANLQLDFSNAPLPGSLLNSSTSANDPGPRFEVQEFKIINQDQAFPYTYRNLEFNYEVVLERPGVVMIVRVVYPRMFNVMQPIVWHVKGASELVLF